ncbi:hypothetical protein HanXRQr2_Chr13g0569451 [Helianthus annuus]|uniref:Uncharacterized protein n=1 Tax=Helianthus annuus TaxID=4232 RepID=A0A9K3EEP8_HELAN|nr:hypothetical protein HanXRQr2_Chr13g0569451 [Helianthus annuus]
MLLSSTNICHYIITDLIIKRGKKNGLLRKKKTVPGKKKLFQQYNSIIWKRVYITTFSRELTVADLFGDPDLLANENFTDDDVTGASP